MHVGSTLIFEGPAPSYEELLNHVEQRLDLVPRFRQKLAPIPFGQGRPVWVDDPHLNIGYHVRDSALPPPGSEQDLMQLAGRIMSQRLDRSKPLWEINLVQGVEGDRFALICKTHHCLVDGVSGMDITTVLFDTAREPKTPTATGPSWQPHPEPSSAELLAEALLEKATKPVEAFRSIEAALRAPRRIASSLFQDIAGIGALAWAGLNPAPKSPLNEKVGQHRRLAWIRADLGEFKDIKNTLGGTVNDVVLSVVTGALRKFLPTRGVITDGLELKAMVPVSVRTDLDEGSLGNKISAVVCPLPVYEAEPIERLHTISSAMADVKESNQAIGAQVITELSGFAPGTIMSQAARLQARQRFFNVSITNVPGPQFPLYVLGRELDDVFPVMPMAENQILGVAVLSYNGGLFFGLVGDYDNFPEIDDFSEYIHQSIVDLLACARRQELAVV